MPSAERKVAKIRVLLCDDHALVREGTRRLLEEEPDIEVVGEASNGVEAVEMAKKLSPHVVAMDVSMPRMNGIEATRRIRESCPGTFILALTAYDDFAYVCSLLENGASGYILKSARIEEVVQAIRAAALGESVLDRQVAKEVFARIARRIPEDAPEDVVPKSAEPGISLTDKELQVLRLVARGLSNKEISYELKVSPRTIQSHLASIFSKLGVTSRTQAVIAGLKKGILSQKDVEVTDID